MSKKAGGILDIIRINRWQRSTAAVPIDFAVFRCEVHISGFVISLMNRQAAGIRVVAENRSASRSGEKLLRELRASLPIVYEWRENAGFHAANYAGCISGIHEILGREFRNNCVFLRICQVRTMTNAGSIAQR